MIGKYLAIMSCILIVIPFCLGVYSYIQHRGSLSYIILLIVFAIWSFIEILTVTFRDMNNHLYLNLNGILTTGLFMLYYSMVNKFSRQLMWFFLVVFIFISGVWFGFFGNIGVWSMPYIILTNIIMLFLSGYSLIALFNQEPDHLFEIFEFWIHTGVLIYFTCSLIYLGFFPILVQSKDLTFIYGVGNVHSSINIIANLIYTYAFICRIRRYKVKYSLQ